jgi:hypothetical protein
VAEATGVPLRPELRMEGFGPQAPVEVEG